MAHFVDVKLELVRPGPPHNQLLSPLTPYLALCGEGSPVTFRVDLEHHKLVSRLQQLRYVVPEGGAAVAVPNRMREAAVVELAETVGGVLTEVRTLLAEVCRARCGAAGAQRYVHLRLVLGGSELSLIPFELSLAPPAMPGEGLELSLQLGMPVVPTREVRSSRLRPVSWDGAAPRVLFVAATPAGATIPLSQHVHALRAALDPWIRWPRLAERSEGTPLETSRLPHVKARLRVLVDASVEDVYEACAGEAFTHVHVLAHGGSDEVAGEQRFGVVLRKRGHPTAVEVVSGKRLASALQAESADGSRRSQPLVVTLATCDSGAPGSVLIPGGSVAHDLHAAGIPWVFASQFPLTVPGSVRLVEALYPRLLRGDDPRQAIYEVRRTLYMRAERDHDWASLVVYASIPEGFEDQIADHFERQARAAIDVGLEHADDASGGGAAHQEEAAAALRAVEDVLRVWEGRLPPGEGMKERARRAECLGMQGSTYKRIALLRGRQAPGAPASAGAADEARAYYRKALDRYRRATSELAMDSGKYHWTATQALTLAAVLHDPPDPATLAAALALANRASNDPDPVQRAWAHGSLAELALLRLYHEATPPDARHVGEQVLAHCAALVDLVGRSSFPAQSTWRQFVRYRDAWALDAWKDVARAAVEALADPGAPQGSA